MPEGNTTPPTSASGNKMWYIIGGIVVLVLVGGFLSRSTGSLGMRAAGVNMNQNMDGSATYTTNEGTVTVGGNKLPDNWPSDVPGIFGGGSVQYSGTSNPQTGQAGSAVVYTVKASAESVIAYYKTDLGKNGWNIDATANMGAASVLSGKKDTRTIGIYVADAGDGTVSVTVGIDM